MVFSFTHFINTLHKSTNQFLWTINISKIYSNTESSIKIRNIRYEFDFDESFKWKMKMKMNVHHCI